MYDEEPQCYKCEEGSARRIENGDVEPPISEVTTQKPGMIKEVASSPKPKAVPR
jgi:hypothetical protein